MMMMVMVMIMMIIIVIASVWQAFEGEGKKKDKFNVRYAGGSWLF